LWSYGALLDKQMRSPACLMVSCQKLPLEEAYPELRNQDLGRPRERGVAGVDLKAEQFDCIVREAHGEPRSRRVISLSVARWHRYGYLPR